MSDTSTVASESIFARVKQQFSPAQVACYLVPDGSQRGDEWVARNPTRSDQTSGSFSINVRTGRWADFASGDRGGDIVDLWQYIRGISEPYEAAKQIADELGGGARPPITVALREPRLSDPVELISPVPDDAPQPTLEHPRHGKAPRHSTYYYRDLSGRVLGIVCRWDTPEGKAIAPRFLFRCADGIMRWCWAGPKPPARKPIYRLEHLGNAETVWIVEGEKTAEAAAAHYLGKSTAVIAWMGGANSVEHVEWSPLANRRVVMFPDQDAKRDADGSLLPYESQPGMRAMLAIGRKLMALGCRVTIIDYQIDPDRDGWDLADAANERWDKQKLYDYCREHKRDLNQKKTYHPTVEDERAAFFGSVQLYTPVRIDKFILGPNGKGLVDCWQNMAEMLNQYGITCRRNDMTHDVIIEHAPTGKELDSNEIYSLCEMNKIKSKMRDGHISVIAKNNAFHPALEWVKSEKWDGLDRIVALFSTIDIHASTPRRLAFSLFYRAMLQAVALLAQEVVGSNGSTPEAHGVLTIVGDQAAGKTRWIRRLCPAEFSMVGVQLAVDNKDSQIKAVSRWIVELGEVSSTKSKSGVAALKAFLTCASDNIRYPYERRAIETPRRTVYFATENSTRYLTDETGNRRWWTIQVNRLDHEHTINMQQFWAQMYHLIHQGEQWWLTHDELRDLNRHNEMHEEDDPIAHMLSGGLRWSAPAHTWTWRELAIVLAQVGVLQITPTACRRAARYLRDRDVAIRTPTSRLATQALVPPVGTEFQRD